MSGFWNETFMVSSPKNKSPSPIKISPIFLTFSLLKKDKTTPINAKSKRYIEIENDENEIVLKPNQEYDEKIVYKFDIME